MELKLESIKDYIEDKYYDFIGFFSSKYQMLQRMFFWGWKMRWSWDFDSHTIYEMLHYKLDRLYNCHLKYSHCVWNSDPNNNLMKKLKEASILAKRLSEDQYDIKAFEEADKKFKLKSWMEKIKDTSYSRYYSTYEITPKRAELYRKARVKIYFKQKQYEKDRLFKLLNQYIAIWWD